MRAVEWQYLDKADIIQLVVKHNAGIELSAEQERRIRGKLENLSAVELWKHIATTYGGVLYEPDVYKPTEREQLEQRAQEAKWKPPIHRKVARDIPVAICNKAPLVDEAETDIFGWRDVKQVFKVGENELYVLVNGNKDKVDGKIRRLYPSIMVTVAVYAGI